ncbi:MAG: peptidoglycan DD-metalloendopeptidase family protein [Burkholderiales bacterium]
MKRYSSLILIIIHAILLAGCFSQPSAVVENKGDKFFGWSGSAPTAKTLHYAPKQTPKDNHAIIVGQGEGLYRIAKEHHINVQDLIRYNHLTPPYHLHVGQVLMVPTGHYHKVQANESLALVARHYQLSQKQLADANYLEPPYVIHEGQLLRIPNTSLAYSLNSNKKHHENLHVPTTMPANAATVITSKPISPPTSTQASNHALLRQNHHPSSQLHTNYPASPLKEKPITANEHSLNNSSPRHYPPASPANNHVILPALPKTRVTEMSQQPLDSDGAALATKTSFQDYTGSKKTNQFIWPVKGKVIGMFGPRENGIRNDGINIASNEGTPIKAAANGTVVYAGNELRGYGNLLIIRHLDGFLTAYAHQQNLIVKKGDSVKQGQTIGFVGITGNVSSPQLHFGVRLGKKAINPIDCLP